MFLYEKIEGKREEERDGRLEGTPRARKQVKMMPRRFSAFEREEIADFYRVIRCLSRGHER